MKILNLSVMSLALCGLMPVAHANTSVCTADAPGHCKHVRVFVKSDGAGGCSAEVEFEKLLLRHGKLDHDLQYALDPIAGDKADYFFDEKDGVDVLEDAAKQVKDKQRDRSNKKKFSVTVKNDQSAKYVIAYIVKVMRHEKSPNPPTLCKAVDPTIENS